MSYPFSAGPGFARDQWYLAAWDVEVTRIPMRRTLLGRPVILWRDAAGVAQALHAVCPHRWMPLDAGRVVEGALECPYHGARFDASGACVRAPLDQAAPARFSLGRLPLVARGPCLMIWGGEADAADPALIPDLARLGLGAPAWRLDIGETRTGAFRPQLLIENLFDQSHIGAVHPMTLGGGRPGPASAQIVEDAMSLCVTHVLPPTATDTMTRAAFPGLGDVMVAKTRVEMLGVSVIASLGSQTFAADADGQIGALLGELNFLHMVTPETASSTHYFTAVTRNVSVADEGFSQALLAHNAAIVAEDIAVLERLEAVIDTVGDPRRETTFASDAGAMRARRRVAAAIAAETARSALSCHPGRSEAESRDPAAAA